jgi:hypothetical protein
MKINEWKEKVIEDIEGEVIIACVIQDIPFHNNTSRFQVYNKEGTYSKLFDITIDEYGDIIEIE